MKIDRMRVFMTRDKDRPRVIVALDTDDGLTGRVNATITAPTRRCRRSWIISTHFSPARTPHASIISSIC